MSGLAGHGGQGLAILGIVPPRRGLRAALALCSLVCLPRLPMALPLRPDRVATLYRVGSPTEKHVQPRARVAMRWHVGRRLAGQERACG